MLEIDDRYPEYARPYEPVKGRKRHGPLTGNEGTLAIRRRLRRLDLARRGFLTGVGVLILVSAFMPARTTRFIMPRGDHKVADIVRELPEPKKIPVVIPEPVPEPDPYVEPDVPVDPTPDPTPDPKPKPKPKPDPKPKPEPKPKPKPKPEPEPEDEKIAPVVDLELTVVQPDNEIYMYPTLSFTMKLNDLKGGKAVGRVYVDTGSGFYEPDDSVKVVYDPSSTSGDKWSDVEIPVKIPTPTVGGISGKAKIVFSITYPDGKESKIETDTRPVHTGSFAYFNTDFGSGGWESGASGTGYYLKFDLIIDDSLLINGSKLDPDKVVEEGQYLWPWHDNVSTERYKEGGVTHIVYTYTSDTEFPNGDYTFYPELSYEEDGHNVWRPDDLYLKFTKH